MKVSRVVASAALAACAGLSASASGQCQVFRNGIPDFDQQRIGLPNTGNMHCVPTSAVNLLGYIANRGVPSVLAGPRNWQSDANHPFITNQILTMGVLMGTDPFDGTTGSDGRDGLRAWLNATAPGMFIVCQYYGDFDKFALLYPFVTGAMVNVCYGYYERDTFGRYRRDGGHCVTLNGLIDFCDSSYQLRWRDPASGDASAQSQSTFTSFVCDASTQPFVDWNNGIHSRIRLWDLGDDTLRRYLDGIVTIAPQFAAIGSVTTSGSAVVRRSRRFAASIPASSNISAPAGQEMRQLALDSMQVEAFMVTYQASNQLHHVWRHNLATGQATLITSSETPIRLATGRGGDLFVQMGATLRRYTFPGGVPTLAQQATTPARADAMTYDDARDEIVMVTTTDRLVRFRNDLSIAPVNVALPAGVTTAGDASLAIDEATQRYYVSGKDDARIFVVGLLPGTQLVGLESEITLPAVQHPECLQFTDAGTLILLSDGVVREFALGDKGWAPHPGSLFDGEPGARALVISRSRTNFTPGVHDGPGWHNTYIPENVVPVPDCNADFNENGVVDSQDFFDYLASFFAQELFADFDFDGQVTSQDFFGFVTLFLNGCE